MDEVAVKIIEVYKKTALVQAPQGDSKMVGIELTLNRDLTTDERSDQVRVAVGESIIYMNRVHMEIIHMLWDDISDTVAGMHKESE